MGRLHDILANREDNSLSLQLQRFCVTRTSSNDWWRSTRIRSTVRPADCTFCSAAPPIMLTTDSVINYMQPCRASPLAFTTSTTGWQPADCGWTKPKLRSCGLVLVSSWSASKSATWRYCWRASRSLGALATWESFSANWRNPRTRLHAVRPDIISSDNFSQSSDRWQRKRQKNGSASDCVHILPVGLL